MRTALHPRFLCFVLTVAVLLFAPLGRAAPPLEECTPLTSAPFAAATSKSQRTQIGRDVDTAAHEKIVAMDAVLVVLEKATKKKPIPCDAYYGSALAYRATLGKLTLRGRLNLLERALSRLSAAAARFPTDPYLLARLAYVQELLGLYGEAATTRRGALKLDDSTRNFSSLVRVLTQSHKLQEAREAARQWTGALPTDANAHVALGTALEAEGDVEAALAEYRKAADLNQDDDTGAVLLGTLLAKLGRWDEADAVFTDVNGSDTPLALYSRAICRDKMGLLGDSFRLAAELEKTGHQVLLGRLEAWRKLPPETAPLLGYAAYDVPFGVHELSPTLE
ncbi:tetratricopeptide repeat protein [Pyxidicoccus sp. MSG2]|uniref:tetratricopeptide repeat protein n=1 Tax=Pyxidicoccus sp. MSG2 TaxID=2996790 RepID=UPI00226E5193|nr:tetratricopeptide repeat protein [Pyxidicoccus sp. MSG2]MCY1023973.1 tetratricopeptide repeat protein [Pyxidicoccus sp. MSG2]